MRVWLRKIREEAGFTQEEVASKCGIGRATYGAIETGERNATVVNAKKIANVLHFNWTIFFEDTCHETKNEIVSNKRVV
ncbi:helix-turn-helix transcriptional regulator [Sutcliffiella horikoshii]|uniref:helix-turn-helix transcriptional regulator n=1 Tax=Sutcliffiella horikoshii TaxID=79883 RepID=UPI00203F5B7F|nr:helix-turn-helix transcriptional regulator [Sutcliffiella horikoshii]MCM3620467.1 helix-turn-helix transcriptional regulator [Sutcliffiella horikoshii]